MFVSAEWISEGRIILARTEGIFQTDDLVQMRQAVIRMLDDKGQEPYVHTIMDNSSKSGVDKTMYKLQDIVTATKPYLQHPLVGYTIIVDNDIDPVLRFLGLTVAQIGKVRFRIFETMDAALRFLVDVDATLDGVALQEKYNL
ncbi:MAG: hypothetical protein SF123_01830 [Chloroflexota bacterium]|nr:hypothetical protein [Chloroflexota bacterium]